MNREVVVYMFEEIADSMTTGGYVAAIVGLVAALTIIVLRVRERQRSGTSRESAKPEDRPDSETPTLSSAASRPDRDETEETAEPVEPPKADPPPPPVSEPKTGSVFKSYVPPSKSDEP